MKYNKYLIFILTVISLLGACQSDFLDEKPNKGLVIPKTLDDLQALLDNDFLLMNVGLNLHLASDDDFYATDDAWSGILPMYKNAHLWLKDVYEGFTVGDWNLPYTRVYYANIVLEGLGSIDRTEENKERWDYIKGSALFYRSLAFHDLVILFATTYDEETAEELLGIPLRINTDINKTLPRASLKQTYEQIINDLIVAESLLKEPFEYISRPGKSSALALLARVSLSMENYQAARDYATVCLDLYDELIDYNTFDPNDSYPFPVAENIPNKEVLFYTAAPSYVTHPLAFVSPELYDQYDDNDLRKSLYFTQTTKGVRFRGTYTGNNNLFQGLATDEVYLIRAECHARLGDVALSMDDLNALMEKRWKEGTFVPLEAENEEEALTLVLRERRKELVGRGLRWGDLKRLNKDPRFEKVLTRTVDGELYELQPNSPRYVLPIPDDEIKASDLQQNPR